MRTRTKVFIGLGIWLAIAVLLGVLFGSEGRNDAFQPQEEFRLNPWIELKVFGIDMSINKAVFYLLLAAIATTATMVYIARRMVDRPNRVQTAIEVAYGVARHNITGQNMDSRMASKWFSFIATLFFFIWFSNMLGYLPLPTNTEHPIHVFGLEIPSLAIYAATANLSIPLALTLVVWIAYHVEGIRVKGFGGFMKSFVPPGISGVGAVPLFVIEVISDVVRIISLSVRLFANILAGHLLILFMAGGLVVLLGVSALGAVTLGMAIPFFLFEIGLVATLQAFIFAILTSIYLGGATADSH
ncbi:MAG TPA: F0F1 ATP synthase subunit A [Thermoleophilaceae bacterium]|nr:F0F1 ATP synthase subunit A [Thermoleophilaceae bacterium]